VEAEREEAEAYNLLTADQVDDGASLVAEHEEEDLLDIAAA